MYVQTDGGRAAAGYKGNAGDCSVRAISIATGIHYPVPVHLQPAYRGRLVAGPSGLGETERAARQILSLPMYPQISEEMIDRIITQIEGFFSRLR